MVTTEPYRTQPTSSVMASVNPYFFLRSEITRCKNWLETMRERNYGKLNSYWEIRSSWLLSKHRELIHRLEDVYTNTESYQRSSVLSPIRMEYRRLWKSVPDSPTCPVAKTERERTVLAFGYDPAQMWKTYTESERKKLRREQKERTPLQNMKDGLIDNFCEDLAKKGAYARQNEFRHRVITEMIGREHWYVLFNTLTVDNANYSRVWGDRDRHSKIWQNYIARITYDIGLALGLKKGEYRQSEIHRYAAVVESGSKNGRLHIHVVHYMKELPRDMVDPNRGRTVPSNQEIEAFKGYWPHGFSTPRAVRFNGRDPYGNLGWRWPVQKSKGQGGTFIPLRVGTISGIGAYLAKYLSKELSGKHNAKESNKWHYRTKMTRGFGLDPYRNLMKLLSPAELRKVCMDPWILPMLSVNGWKPPQGLMIREATREYLNRMSVRGSTKIYDILHAIRPQTNIVKQYSQILDMLIMDHLTLSEEASIGNILIWSMRKPVISEEQLIRQRRMVPSVQRKINMAFGPAPKSMLIKHGPVDIRQ